MAAISLALWAGTTSLASWSAPADEVRALFEKGQARQAWQLGRQSGAEMGKPAFDYWFGLAAIDSGEPADGVLALERYLLNNPGSVVARLELGRGYLALGDTARAREMFDEVLRLNPPPAVRQRIERLMAAIRERESAFRPSFSAHVEAAFGHDSNANSGIGQDSITLPLFGTLALTEDGKEKADRFHGVLAGAQVNVPLRPGLAWFAGAQVDSRNFDNAGQFDQRTLGGATGLAWNSDPHTLRLSFSGNRLAVQSRDYRTLSAITLEWSRNVDATRGLSVFAQSAKLAYAGDNSVRDADLQSIGASWRQSFDTRWQPFLSVGVNLGREDNKRNRDDLGRDTHGIRAGLGLALSPRVTAALAVSAQKSRYKAFDEFLGARRDDRFMSAEIAVGYTVNQNLGARIEVSRQNNDSNIALFEYKRTLAALKLRYDFK
jgi:tetratricopeptide (TPR) repeat protein